MEPLAYGPHIESRRMELRAVVRLAGEVIAQYWPMRTFVHHNPLHSIEYLPFEEAVKRGKQFLGGNGYLPSHLYREYLEAGRIRPHDLDNALKPFVIDKHVTVGSHIVTHGSVLRACLTEGLCAPAMEPLDDQLEDPQHDWIDDLARKLGRVVLPFPLATIESEKSWMRISRPLPMAHTFALVRRHARHTDRPADQRTNDQVVRSLPGRRSCHMDHAGT